MLSRDDDAELQALKELSAAVGANPLLIEAAGGNTSIKLGDTLWIKASGTWLANALTQDIMVPVSMPPLLEAVARRAPEAEQAQIFTVAALNPSGLRPSIETTVHAVMPQRVVVHVHCVDTIAIAVRADAQAIVAERLKGLNWAFVPYCRPGLPLALAILEVLRPGTDILVLGNHGLVVAAETVAEAGQLLQRICGLLAQPARAAPAPDLDALRRLAADSPFQLPAFPEAHGVATDLVSCRIAAPGNLFPDQVVFLDETIAIAGPKDSAASIAAATTAAGKAIPVSILFPGKGVLMRRDANAGAQAMARCRSNVMARIPQDARILYFTAQDMDELLNWDAEKYRLSLNQREGSTLQ